MKRERFVAAVEQALDSLPQELHGRICHVAVLAEDSPPNPPPTRPGQRKRLLVVRDHGVPTAKKSIFDVPTGSDHIVLHQKNIAGCSSANPWLTPGFPNLTRSGKRAFERCEAQASGFPLQIFEAIRTKNARSEPFCP
jgi:hypothetical protein